MGYDQKMSLKGHGSKWRWKALSAIGLCGCLAFVISIVSPADDETQQEFLAGRTRHHAVRLLKAKGPGSSCKRVATAKALPARREQQHRASTQTSIALRLFQLPGGILADHTGSRSPPLTAL